MFQSSLPFPGLLSPLQTQSLGPLQQSQGLGGFGFFGPGNDTVNIINGPPGPPGPPGPAGPPGTPGLVTVTAVNVTPYEVQLTDYMLAVDVEGPVSIVLPVAPVGTVFIVKDSDGDAQTNPITVTATGSTIDGQPSYVLNIDYSSITLVFTGTEWNVI